MNLQILKINSNPKGNTSPFSPGRILQVWPALIVEKGTAVPEALVTCSALGTRDKTPGTTPSKVTPYNQSAVLPRRPVPDLKE